MLIKIIPPSLRGVKPFLSKYQHSHNLFPQRQKENNDRFGCIPSCRGRRSHRSSRFGISLALRANITAQRAISRCQRQHITATLRILQRRPRRHITRAPREYHCATRNITLPKATYHCNAPRCPDGGRGTAPPRKSQPVNNRTSPLLRIPITSKACMESRRSLVWNPQLVAVWNHAKGVYGIIPQGCIFLASKSRARIKSRGQPLSRLPLIHPPSGNVIITYARIRQTLVVLTNSNGCPLLGASNVIDALKPGTVVERHLTNA